MTRLEKILTDMVQAHAVQMSAGRKVAEGLKALVIEIGSPAVVKPEMLVSTVPDKPKAKTTKTVKKAAKPATASSWPTKCTVGTEFEYTRTSKTSKSKGKTFLYTVTAVDKTGKPASWTKSAV